jgi:hypothetical protein
MTSSEPVRYVPPAGEAYFPLASNAHVLVAVGPHRERSRTIKQVLDDLQESVSAGPAGAFNSLARHLYRLQRFHREQKLERYASDTV